MSSISLQGPRSTLQSSIAAQKSIVDQGLNELFSLRNFYDKFLFPFYDELFRMVKLNSFFSVLIVIVLIDQIFVSSSIFIQETVENFFTNFNVSYAYEEISLPMTYLVVNIAFFIYLFFNYRSKRIFNFWQLYLASIFLNFFNVIFFVPSCGVCGYSVYQLDKVINLHYSDTLYLSPDNFRQTNNYAKLSQKNIGSKFLFNNTSKFSKFILSNYYKYKNKNNPDKNKETTFLNNNYNQSFKNSNLNNNINISINRQNQIYNNTNFRNKKPPPNPHKFTQDDPNDPKDPSDPKDPNDPNGPGSQDQPFDFEDSDEENQLLIILNHDFTKHTSILIFFTIEAIILYGQIVITFRFMSESPYLNRTIFAMWDCQVFIQYLLLMGANQFFFYFLKILPKWCTTFYQIVVLISIVYIMYYTLFQPFVKISMNTLFQSLLSTFFISTFFSLIFILKQSTILFFLIFFSTFFFFIFMIVYYIINKKIYKAVNKKLSPPSAINSESVDESLESSDSQYSKKLKGKYSAVRSKDELSIDEIKHDLNENEKREIFDSFVFQSIEHALLYFRVGVSLASPYFVDFSFIRYMKECYGQRPIQLFILQLSALFPSQHQFFNFCITTFCKKVEFFNIYENFILYQLHRINIIRQSSVSKEVQNELFRLEKMSDDSISAIRGFWSELLQAKTDFNTSSLGFIRKLSLSTKSNYIDAIEKFPNSQQLLNSYCRFLCEACGDYIECARVGQKMRLIEQGKNSNADHCFHSFVNVFPHYLKNRILSAKGNFIMNNGSFSSSQSSASISSERLSASFDNARGMPLDINSTSNANNFNYSSPLTIKKRNKDEFENLIEQEHFETLINNLYTNAKQRLSIQAIVEHSKNISISFARWVSIIQCIISFVIIILTFSYVSSSSNTVTLMESATRTSKISASFEYCSLVASIQFLSETYGINITDNMLSMLHIREENLPNFACSFIFPVVSLNTMKQNIVELFNEEMKYIMKDPDNHLQELKIYTGLDLFYETDDGNGDGDGDGDGDGYDDDDDEDEYDYEYGENETYDKGIYIFKFLDYYPVSFLLTVRNAVEYYQSTVERLSYEKSIMIFKELYPNITGQSYVKHHKYSEKFIKNRERMKVKNDLDFSIFYNTYLDLLTNCLVLAGPFNQLFTLISDNSIQITKKYELKIRLASEACLIVFFVLFTLIRLYNLIIIKQLIKVSSIAIKRVKSNDITEAMKPIYLKSKKAIKIHSANNHSIFEYSPTILVFSIIGFCSIVVFIGFYSIALYIFLESFNFIEKTFSWANEGSKRFLQITNLMNSLIADRIGIFNFNLSALLIRDALDLLDYTEKIDMSIIGRDKTLDNFYFMINEDRKIWVNLNGTNETNTKSKSKYPFNIDSIPKPKSKSKSKLDKNYNFDKFIAETVYNNKKCTSFDNSNESSQMNFATYLDCISIESKINLVIHYYILLSHNIQEKYADEILNVPEFDAILFIIDKYLFRVMPEFQDQLLYITESEIAKQKNIVYIIGTIGIVLSIIFCIIELVLIKNISFSYEAFKQLIMVLPPSAFTNNPFLINFLVTTCTRTKLFVKISNNSIISSIAKLSHHKDNILSDEESLINATDHAIVNTCKNLIIQYVNPAVQKMTGFPSDQLLGQGLIYLIPLISKKSKSRMSLERSPFYQRLEEIRSNSGDRIAEVNTICLTDKGDEMNVQATIIGIFDKKNKINQKDRKKIPLSRLIADSPFSFANNNSHNYNNDDDDDSGASTNSSTNAASNATNTTTDETTNTFNLTSNNGNNIDDDDEEFVGATIILYDISNESVQKKEVKKAKKKTEALVNLLIPSPVLEQIRTSKKSQFYNVEKATLVKIEFCGLEEYIGSVMPKTLMTFLQNLYAKIMEIGGRKNEKDGNVLFDGAKLTKNESNVNVHSLTNTNEEPNFQFNFNFNFSVDTEFSPRRNTDQTDNYKPKIDHNKQPPSNTNGDANDGDCDEINDNDENCDFGCVYNIRNDVDNFISISGLFEDQNDLKKQAESCLRYAMKVKQIIENFELEEQFNLFIHARIVVCMGGPIDSIVDDPENPNLEIFSSLISEADRIRDICDLDSVCINEDVYQNIIKENYEIEEKVAFDNNESESGEKSCHKVYTVNRCVMKKKNENESSVFVIND